MKLNFSFNLFFLFITQCVHASEPMRFVLPNFPPYTYQDQEEIAGIGVVRVKKILEAAGIEYNLSLTTDYDRAIYELRKGNSDGFFLASKNNERDQIAVFTKPAMLNAWVWILPATSKMTPDTAEFKNNALVGTILNTNTHKWLIKNQYKVGGKVLETAALIKMLNKGRLDALFLSQSVFELGLNESGGVATQYQLIVQNIRPFGIYISKQYLAKNPDVVKKLNKVIDELTVK